MNKTKKEIYKDYCDAMTCLNFWIGDTDNLTLDEVKKVCNDKIRKLTFYKRVIYSLIVILWCFVCFMLGVIYSC